MFDAGMVPLTSAVWYLAMVALWIIPIINLAVG